uniref:Alcohol dehydrogenase-like N-terminal domain-containing protein n=1 Tax=Setaria viridis TaxID=4556 RepID=A0A4U6TBC0_SETVI|nr:hypothetical protein SEVIR_9G289050v2 [Setaria viridis]
MAVSDNGCRARAAAVAWDRGEPLSLKEVEVAPPGRLEVRIKVLFSSICHTDLSAWKGEKMHRKFPCIVGHETAGVVESVGDGVEDLVPGDHVVPIFTRECRECVYCGSDKMNLCGMYRANLSRAPWSPTTARGSSWWMCPPTCAGRSTTSSTPPPSPSTPCSTRSAPSGSTPRPRWRRCTSSAAASPQLIKESAWGGKQRGTLQTFPRVQRLQYSGLVLLVLRLPRVPGYQRGSPNHRC